MKKEYKFLYKPTPRSKVREVEVVIKKGKGKGYETKKT